MLNLILVLLRFDGLVPFGNRFRAKQRFDTSEWDKSVEAATDF